MLTSEDRAGLGHHGLDVGMTDPGPDGFTPMPPDDLRDGSRRDQVVNDPRSRFAGQLTSRDQRGQRRRGHDAALLIDHKTTIRVAVEGESHVCAGLQHLRLEVTHVGWIDRVGLVVGERTVEVEEQRDEFGVQPREHSANRVTAHAVTGIDHHLEPATADRHQLVQVIGVGDEQVAMLD